MTDSETRLLQALQKGLPLSLTPWADLADQLGLSQEMVLCTVAQWESRGIIRRIGAFVNHYKGGFVANGMVVWQLPEERLREVGEAIALFSSVSHCYARPQSPQFPYRLYSMLHGPSRGWVEQEAARIAKSVGLDSYRILFTNQEFKKTGWKLPDTQKENSA